MNAILIGTLTGTSNNRIEVFTRKIIIHYPKAPKKIILLSDVLAVELRKGASVYNLTFIHCGELTFGSSDDSSASRPSDSSKFKEVFYFENRENNLDIAARIRNYIKTAIPQLTEQEIAAKLEEIKAKENIERNYKTSESKPIENNTSSAFPASPPVSHGVIRHWGCSGIFVFVAGIIMFIIWMCNEEKSDSRIVIWGAMGLIACLYVWFQHIFNALKTQNTTKLVLLIFLPIIGVILCEFLPDDPS